MRWCWKPTRPTSRRTGCTRTAQQRAAGQPQGRNEPGELPRIAQAVAQLRGMAVDELAQATTRNACVALPRLSGLVPLGLIGHNRAPA
jgi:TatD DNase family protein